MGMTLVEPVPVPAIVAQTPTLVKRQKVLDLLTSGLKLSDRMIGLQAGCSRDTVLRLRQKLNTQGVAAAMLDRRVDNGSEARYDKVWKLIEDLKKQYPSWGGRQFHFHLETVLNMSEEELPAVSSIEDWLSRKKLTHREVTAKTDKRPYFMEDYYRPMVRCGMDCQTVAPYGKGSEITVISVIDFWSRAVYSEAFPWNATDSHYRGVNQAQFAGVFVRFCTAFGVPKVLVLDNGAGQISSHGWLPEIARIALAFGVRVEWEPPARPWRNGAIENWHKHSQNWWEGVRASIRTLEDAQRVWRERAWLYTTRWRQRKLKNMPASSVLEICNPWPLDGVDAGPIVMDTPERCQHEWTGIVSIQREVETNGYVKVHGNDHMFVSEMLIGGYVRVDFSVRALGAHGVGSVFDGKGRLVGNFKHQMECKRDSSLAFVYDYNAVGYADSQDVRAGFIDQQKYNKMVERAQKNPRSQQDYLQTGSSPIMKSRKKSAKVARA